MSSYDLPDDLTGNPNKILVQKTFSGLIERAATGRSVSPGAAKSYFEFCDLVKTSLDDYESRLGSPNKLNLSWEYPDKDVKTEIVTINLVKRQPGMFDQGAPFEGSVKNLRPIHRETKEDKENPGYRKVIQGKFYDNLIRFTCWAQTNKEAIDRSFWFENFIEKYTWFFAASGVKRVIFWGQEEDVKIDNYGQKLYGRPLLFYVQTEELTEHSEKEMEQISINLLVKKQ